jgi:hypothetical protein
MPKENKAQRRKWRPSMDAGRKQYGKAENL